MRALIIENSRLYRQFLDTTLREQGFENDICSSLAQAREFIDAEQYQLLCVNQHLEDGKGRELIHYCNQHAENSKTPILYFTTDDNRLEVDDSLRIDQIIVKRNLQQVSDQVVRFIEQIPDPLRSEIKILFIEDSESIARVILSHLGNAGYKSLAIVMENVPGKSLST